MKTLKCLKWVTDAVTFERDVGISLINLKNPILNYLNVNFNFSLT